MNIKTQLILILKIILTLNLADLLGQGLTLPEGDAGIEDAIGRGIPSEPTAEELADPPIGEMQKLYLRNVNESRSGLAAVLAAVPAGPEGRQSELFTKLQTIKTGLDQLASSRLESQLFSLIPKMAEVFALENENAPYFVSASTGWLQNMSLPIFYTIASHVKRQNANVTEGNLINFLKLFTTSHGFIAEGDWENDPKPINASGVMILDAAAVVAQLKSGPWQQAKQFLGGATTASAYFARYTESGDGLSVLKTKYAANQSAIEAKFNELKTWIDAQAQQAEGGN